jgi:mono/diheme cytochrome c family protein
MNTLWGTGMTSGKDELLKTLLLVGSFFAASLAHGATPVTPPARADIALQGKVLQPSLAGSQAECLSACQATPGCSGFSFAVPGFSPAAPKANCTVLTGTLNEANAPGVVSCRMPCVDPVPPAGVRHIRPGLLVQVRPAMPRNGMRGQEAAAGPAASAPPLPYTTPSPSSSNFSHTQPGVTGQCASCHNGASPPADGKPGNHVPYASVPVAAAANCDSCHKGSYTSWANGKFHANFSVTSQCLSCHTGAFLAAVGKPGTPVHAGVTVCESCHASTASFLTSSFNHTQVVVTGQCASCHTGSFPPADGKPINHVPYASVAVAAAANCDSCHKGSYTSWANGRFHANFSVSAQCVACHTGNYLAAVGKPATAVHAGVTSCEGCHTSTATFLATSFNHVQPGVIGQCASCHNGASPPADGKPINHVPYASVAVAATANCDSCHKGSYTSWANGRFHANFSVSAQCSTCHTGSYLAAVGKPATAVHAGVTSCEGCHQSTTGAWKPAT